MTRRIGPLDTPESCRKECEQVYRRAWKGEIAWKDAPEAARVLESLNNMFGGGGQSANRNSRYDSRGIPPSQR